MGVEPHNGHKGAAGYRYRPEKTQSWPTSEFGVAWGRKVRIWGVRRQGLILTGENRSIALPH